MIQVSQAMLAEALFASTLQPSDAPTPREVRAAVRASLHKHHGSRGCAALCAAEYGDHPETAAMRMRWALALVRPPTISAHAA